MLRISCAFLALAAALALTGCESPDAFPYNPDTQPALSTAQPIAPSAKAPPATPPHTIPADSTALTSLQGEWALVSILKDGKTLSTGEKQVGKIVITGKRFVLLGAKEIGNMSVGTISIDPAQNPKTITLVADPKDADGKARFGIYDFPESQDFLRIAIPEPGNRKPDGFSPAKGQSILVFKRTQTPAK